MADDVSEAIGESSGDSIAEDVALLSGEGEDTTAQEGTDITLDPDDKEGEEVEEEPGQEEETEEETEEKAEPVDQNVLPGRPSFKEIKKEFPDFFKKFPAVREAMARESQFTRVFPTVEEADHASQVSQVFTALENRLSQGESGELLGALKNDGHLDDFADKFLPTLEKTDSKAYLRTVTPIFLRVYDQMIQAGKASGDKNMVGAAQRLSLHLFGQLQPPADFLKQLSPAKPTVDPEKVRLQEQLAGIEGEKFSTFQNDVIGTAEQELRRTAGIGLDPEGKYSQFQKDALLDKLLTEVDKQLGSNTQHQREMQSLWSQAQRSGLTKQIRDRIITTYLGRAKPILNNLKARVNGVPAKKPGAKVPVSRSVPGKAGPSVNAKTVDWNKTSDEDFMAGKVTLRK